MPRMNTIRTGSYEMTAYELINGSILVVDNLGNTAEESAEQFAARVVNAIAAGASVN